MAHFFTLFDAWAIFKVILGDILMLLNGAPGPVQGGAEGGGGGRGAGQEGGRDGREEGGRGDARAQDREGEGHEAPRGKFRAAAEHAGKIFNLQVEVNLLYQGQELYRSGWQFNRLFDPLNHGLNHLISVTDVLGHDLGHDLGGQKTY